MHPKGVAMVRGVPESFTQALVMDADPRLDVVKARREHDAYTRALTASGYSVETIPADENHPDSPFIEDTLVVIEDTAVITRPGAESRREEIGPVAEAIAGYLRVRTIEEPGLMDGGDILQVGGRVYAGLSKRTNQAAIDQLADAIGRDVTAVPVTGVLHLKSAISVIDDETVLISPGTFDQSLLNGLHMICKPTNEVGRACVMPLRDGTVMSTAACPETVDLVEKLGYQVTVVDTSEFQTADGGLSCLSVLF